MQLQDIKDLGNVSEVASLLAPSGVTFSNQETTEVEQPARDTGTIRGTVLAKPQTLYRSELTHHWLDLILPLNSDK